MAQGLQEQKLIFYINPTNWKSGTNKKSDDQYMEYENDV